MSRFLNPTSRNSDSVGEGERERVEFTTHPHLETSGKTKHSISIMAAQAISICQPACIKQAYGTGNVLGTVRSVLGILKYILGPCFKEHINELCASA